MRIFFLYAIVFSFLSISFADYFHNIFHENNYEISHLGEKSNPQGHTKDCDFEKISKAYSSYSKLLNASVVELPPVLISFVLDKYSSRFLIDYHSYSILRVRGPPGTLV